MRIELDEAGDRAIVYFSDEPQSVSGGATYLALVHNEDDPEEGPAEVQLGFEENERLLFMIVHPASTALPADLLASAVRIFPKPYDPDDDPFLKEDWKGRPRT